MYGQPRERDADKVACCLCAPTKRAKLQTYILYQGKSHTDEAEHQYKQEMFTSVFYSKLQYAASLITLNRSSKLESAGRSARALFVA